MRILQKLEAGPNQSKNVRWTSLREEPVLYVNGKPYVLRLFIDPLRNLEATVSNKFEFVLFGFRASSVKESSRWNSK